MSNEINRESEITVFDNFADGNIEVLFQDEVALDVDVSLFYIKSGQEEIQYYVDHVSKPEINKLTASQIEKIKNVVAEQTADAKEQLEGYAENTIQPSIDTYVETEVVPELDNYKNTAASFATMAQTSAEAAQVSAAEASEAIDGFDAHVQQKQTDFDNNAALKQSAVDASAATASENATAAANSAEAAAESALNASVGNIGDIKYTARIDLPNGGVWADGAEYTQSEFPDVYQMLVSQKLQSVSMADFNNKVAADGVCGYFGVDTANASFKVPLLQNVYLKAGTGTPEFAAESLPNITGSFTYASDPTNNRVGLKSVAGAFYGTDSGNNFQTSHNNTSMKYASTNNFDASRCSAAYQAGAKVNPDHVVYRAYVVLYSSVAEVSITDYTQQLEAVTNTGIEALSNASNALRTTQVTDCITEIPQNIKLEPAGDGRVTLKAGSKFYIPNGFEEDGTTPKFDEATLSVDAVLSIPTTADHMVFFSETGLGASYISYAQSGSTAPTENIDFWYDTATNTVKRYINSSWVPGYSLPFCILRGADIKHVFNGLGYIGKTLFYLPGLKFLISNGRNTDGSLNNIEQTITSVVIKTYDNQTTNFSPFVYEINGAAGVVTNGKYYEKENYFKLDNGTNFICCTLGYCRLNNGVIEQFSPKLAYKAADCSDSSWLAQQSFPSISGTRISYPQPSASGTTYIAPANGYIHVAAGGWENNAHLTVTSASLGCSDHVQTGGAGGLHVFLPVAKGMTFTVLYSGAYISVFNFIYAEGEV